MLGDTQVMPIIDDLIPEGIPIISNDVDMEEGN